MIGDDKYLSTTSNEHHGTRCAGEIAMRANNKKCGVGVAYDSKVGMVRMLGKSVTDTMEGQALNFGLKNVHVYSASWGPTDNGYTLEGPGYMASSALKKGVTEVICLRSGDAISKVTTQH